MRYLYVLLIAMLLVGTQPVALAQAGAASINTLAAPTSVTLAGDLQNELGCSGDWDPACATTHLAFDADDQIWQSTFSIPAGSYNYKAAIDDSWAISYGLNTGPDNIPLSLAAAADVKFYYSDATHWVTDNVNSVIATAAGNFQSELGCPGDWQPNCLRSWLQDTNGDGTYTFSTTAIPAGNYEGKVALDEAWDESYPGSNIPFTVSDGDTVNFSYNSATNAVNISVTGSGGSDNDFQFAALGHNSRDTIYRNPGGAVPTGTPIKLRLRSAVNDLQEARVRVWDDRLNVQTMHDMTRVANSITIPGDAGGPYDFWEATLPASADPTVYWYRFIVKDGTKTAYYEDDNKRTGGWGEAFAASPDNGYQLTIYDPAFSTPDWIKNAVVYQVFPDRFRDGNAANNQPADGFFYGNNDTIVRSNATDWNTPICDPRARPGAVAACENAYSQNFYGGDLQGLIDEIDYLDDLGITVIYLNPIFESPSNHKYDTTNYGLIDDNFGDLATFQALVAAADAKGMRIVLDGVFNHVSSDSPYMDRYGRFAETGACESETSPYRDWFYFTDVAAGTGDCVGSDGTAAAANYESWWGYDSLPKLKANTPQVRQLIWDSASPSPTEGVAPYWIDQGADGWRLDVGGDVDPGTLSDPTNDYWEGFRDAIHASDPEGYIVGEEWGNATSWTIGSEWDATMNYQFSAAVLSFWRDEAYTDNDFNSGSSAGELNPITAEALNERLLNLKERYPPEAFAAMMNLFGSHDTNRAMFLLNHDADLNDTSLYVNPAYDWSDSRTRLKGAALLQMTMPGAPTIYYGDEIGLVGPVSYDGSRWQDDPYNRQPYPWLDETGTPYYNDLSTPATRDTMFAYYQTLTSARNTHPALRTGSFDPLLADTGSPVYVYGRKMADDSNAAIIAVNKSNTNETVVVDVAGYIPAGATLSDVLSSATFTVNSSGQLQLNNVPAQGGYLLVVDAGFAGDRPAAPVITAAPESGKVTVSWSAVSGADSYDVYRTELSGGAYTLIGNTNTTSYEDTTVNNGTRYYYVVKSKSATLLVSEFSNEVSAIPAYTIGWANLQWPPTLNHTRSLITPTAEIYGQVYIDGVTNSAGETLGLVAEVGYGDNDSLPTDTSWQWFSATFNTDSGNNDEFKATMIVDAAPGNYDYLYRYSTDGRNSWVYGTTTGLIGSDLSGYLSANAGQMTVVANSDIAAPDAPTNLAITGTTTSSISLGWDTHPDTEGDLYGFEIWRKNNTDSEVSFTRVDLLNDPAAITYTDTTVTANKEYDYYITAMDDAVNPSTASNTVTAIAEMRMVSVTFRVTVPDPTPGTVYIAGGFNGFDGSPYPAWNPGGIIMTETATPGVWEVTLNLLDGYGVEYKYARGTWEKVEKQADGSTEVANRPLTVDYGTTGTQLVTDTVEMWRDPIVTSFSPAADATGVVPSATVTAAWNQSMADPADPATCLSVTGPGGTVAGTVSYDSGLKQYTFSPSAALAAGSHTVNIADCKDAGGDVQQVAKSWSFEVADTTDPAVISSLRAGTSPTNAASVDFIVTFSEVVTGVNEPDFGLTATGTLSDTVVTGVSGTGTTYTVTVSTGTGSGALRLDVLDTADIADLSSNLLANLPYQAGQSYQVRSQIFDDVPNGHWAWSWIERLYNAGITSGCGISPLIYCPENSVTRAQMAIFILRGIHGTSYTPPAATGTVFGDVPATHPHAAWIEALAAQGITSGCGNGNYCPNNPVTRAQMAVFLLKAKHGSGYTPPAVGADSGFGDVSTSHWAAAWIKQLAAESITSGCGAGNFCPNQAVSRAQMAVFLVKTFDLP